MKTLTEAAQVAKLIRYELKLKYPHVKFQIRSENFAGGDAVRIDYTMQDETYPRPEQVSDLVDKYQAGHFDGSQDLYINKPNQTGLTVKYVQVQANTQPLEEKHKQNFLNYYNLTAFDDTEIRAKLNCWKEQALYKYIRNVVLTK